MALNKVKACNIKNGCTRAAALRLAVPLYFPSAFNRICHVIHKLFIAHTDSDICASGNAPAVFVKFVCLFLFVVPKTFAVSLKSHIINTFKTFYSMFLTRVSYRDSDSSCCSKPL